ncbi:serine/threonine-protein kinase [Pseudoxanthomonas broegbernensis]|uniref:serine/threonine-protein kinase n=1 Tax=Pseudoxanthomonas broegbernensis TaxID=83619 RepID=UPI00161E5D98|nr:serine/threonine-protein kinase [Pseudoxanthomonas broegbernensis]MBB6065560.1 serine/threonine-protein kinase [Pseudoxanthomonas broegbernensis]
MDPRERQAWQAADAILDTLLDLPADARESHLRTLSHDPEVTARVRALLAGSQREGPLDRPLSPPPDLGMEDAPPPSLRGRRLGRWTLEHWLGEGGMAVVWKATSAAPPLGQQAAVKILSLGALARGGHERFLREQSVLARLRHPYIVPLYEAGVGEDGTPWLAMALVEGQRIDQWCQSRRLDLPGRLDLVEQVGEALAHAHRNLVVHRDVKPSNVLVDEDGLVRLLDFGIGRELSAGAPTHTRLCALTPEYAAPEQASGQDSGTAADVYGLAALTYRLLAGSPPNAQGRAAGQEPERASARASRMPRGSPERGFAARLRGDLDAVLLRALAQEPARRYTSVESFVADLRRYRARRPVQALAPRAGYRLRRFVQRNRWPLAVAALLSASLLAGGLGVLWQAQRAERAAEEARLQLRYLESLLQELAPSTAEARAMDRGRLITSAAGHARNDLARRPGVLATVLLALAEIAEAAGDHRQSERLAAEAAELRERLHGADSVEYAQALVVRGHALWSERGPDDPAVLAERALAIYERRAPDSDGHMRALVLQQVLDGSLDRIERARAGSQRTLAWCRARGQQPFEVCNQVLFAAAALYDRQGHVREAEPLYAELVELRTARHGAGHARTLHARTRHARAVLRLGDAARAAALLEPVLATQREIYDTATPELAGTRGALAEALTALGEFSRARALHEAQLAELADARGGAHPEVAAYLGNFGVFLFKAGDFEGALARLAECAAAYATQAGPDHAGVHVCNGNRADVLREMGRAAEAEPLGRAALEGIRAAFGEDSPLLAPRYSNLGRILVALGRDAEALPLFARARAIYREQDAPVAALIHLYELDVLVRTGQVPPDRGWNQALDARARLEAGFPARNPLRTTMLVPLARIACSAPRRLPCAALRDEALAAMAQAATPADARQQIGLVLRTTEDAVAVAGAAATGPAR